VTDIAGLVEAEEAEEAVKDGSLLVG